MKLQGMFGSDFRLSGLRVLHDVDRWSRASAGIDLAGAA